MDDPLEQVLIDQAIQQASLPGIVPPHQYGYPFRKLQDLIDRLSIRMDPESAQLHPRRIHNGAGESSNGAPERGVS